jgi:hypothetical protein
MSRISKPSSLQPQPKLLKRLWLESQTKLLASAQAVSGLVLYTAAEAHTFVTSPEVSNALGQLTLPKWFPVTLLVLAALTYIAHGHKEDA